MKIGVAIIIALGIIILILLSVLFFVPARRVSPKTENKIVGTNISQTKMTIQSSDFSDNRFIPKKFSCEGENINPELRISGVPENAASLVLIMDDPDAPRGTFTHWLVWNINPKISVIAESSVPANAMEGKNDSGKTGYIGPCPPPGNQHRYFFKLYALSKTLTLGASANKQDLENEISQSLLAESEIVGLYKR